MWTATLQPRWAQSHMWTAMWTATLQPRLAQSRNLRCLLYGFIGGRTVTQCRRQHRWGTRGCFGLREFELALVRTILLPSCMVALAWMVRLGGLTQRHGGFEVPGVRLKAIGRGSKPSIKGIHFLWCQQTDVVAGHIDKFFECLPC